MSLHRPSQPFCTTTPRCFNWKTTSSRLQLCQTTHRRDAYLPREHQVVEMYWTRCVTVGSILPPSLPPPPPPPPPPCMCLCTCMYVCVCVWGGGGMHARTCSVGMLISGRETSTVGPYKTNIRFAYVELEIFSYCISNRGVYYFIWSILAIIRCS